MSATNQMDCDLSRIPIRALSLSTRHQLSQYLNGEQLITTSKGLSRDYRGIVELMGYSYAILNSISGTTDPLKALLEMHQNRSDATVGQLVAMIEDIERFDVVDDMTPALVADAVHYLSDRQARDGRLEVQRAVLELTPVPEEIVIYDAYVCYADNDFPFVQQLSQFLESPKIGLRLFIRDRDMCLGSWAYESFAQVIDCQCRKVLIIFSPDFLRCPECDFQTAFATGLAIEQRNRKLIPIIHKRCDLPPIIRMLTKIDMTRSADTNDWSWSRLVASIRNNVTNNSIVYRQFTPNNTRPALLQLPSHSSNSSTDSPLISIETLDDSVISLPSVCPTPTAPPLISTQSSICSSLNSETSDKSDASDCVPILCSQNLKNSKKSNHKKWIQSFKQKFKG